MDANKYLTTSALLIAAIILSAVPTRLSAQEPEATATLFLHVNTNYDDSEASLKELRTLIKYVEPGRETLKPGQSISDLIAKIYNVTKLRLPLTYQLIENEVVRLNNLAQVEDAKPGELLLPQIPESTIKAPVIHPSHSTRSMAMADITFMDQLPTGQLTTATVADDQIEDLPKLNTEPEAHGDEVIQPLVVPIRELMTAEGRELVTAANGTVEEPMKIRFAGQQVTDKKEIQILTDQQRENIANLINNNAQRSPVVFILDSGWPNLEAYRESREVLLKAFDDIWERWGIVPAKRPKREPELSSLEGPLDPHCQTIERGLREFRSLDSGTPKKIRVVYLPLILGQKGDGLVRELLEIYFIAKAFGGAMGEVGNKLDLNTKRDRNTLSNAEKFAVDTIKVLRALAEKMRHETDGASLDFRDVTSNKGLLQATLALGQFIASRDNSVFFLNESWTLSASLLSSYESPSEMFGMPVAAVGNEANVVVTGTDTAVDFARRSFHKKDVIAVMNFRPDVGKQCSTSIVDANLLSDTQVVGYDGRVSDDPHECMTSFAAPRVAWLLACAEAIRPHLPSRTQWAPDLETRLKNNRSQQAGLDSTIFDPIKFLQSALTN